MSSAVSHIDDKAFETPFESTSLRSRMTWSLARLAC
ncbi:hypothetical protein AZE42_01235 [Rhizopogon vesiculosus]|uniref:Uncharacterized protein n=1 Tax=Rhizopogon vesiculosus TaxID=180088 RepID=A0A1J8QA98_9AGAM|nr:hypothetical protein AZE42_01235 [Rhizopogon vesiculosus]